jgi:hypothetical protein
VPHSGGAAESVFAGNGSENLRAAWLERLADATWGGLQPGHVIGEPVPLFPRKDEK